MRAKQIRWLMAFMWMGVIFSFSQMGVIASSERSVFDFVFKKSAHVVEYFILFILFSRAFGNKEGLSRSFVWSMIYAFSDEIHQLFIPGRTGKISDVMIFDFIGMTLGYIVASRYQRIWK